MCGPACTGVVAALVVWGFCSANSFHVERQCQNGTIDGGSVILVHLVVLVIASSFFVFFIFRGGHEG